MGSKIMLLESYTCLMFAGRTLSFEVGMSIEMPCEGKIPAWTSNFALSCELDLSCELEAIPVEELRAQGSRLKSQVSRVERQVSGLGSLTRKRRMRKHSAGIVCTAREACRLFQ